MSDKYNIRDESGRYIGSAEKDPTPSVFSPTGGESYNVYNSTGSHVGRVEGVPSFSMPTRGLNQSHAGTHRPSRSQACGFHLGFGLGAVVMVVGGLLFLIGGVRIIAILITTAIFLPLLWGLYLLLRKFGVSTTASKWVVGILFALFMVGAIPSLITSIVNHG